MKGFKRIYEEDKDDDEPTITAEITTSPTTATTAAAVETAAAATKETEAPAPKVLRLTPTSQLEREITSSSSVSSSSVTLVNSTANLSPLHAPNVMMTRDSFIQFVGQKNKLNENCKKMGEYIRICEEKRHLEEQQEQIKWTIYYLNQRLDELRNALRHLYTIPENEIS